MKGTVFVKNPNTKVIATLGDPDLKELSQYGTYRSGIFDLKRGRIGRPTLEAVVNLLIESGADVLRLNLAHIEEKDLAAKFRNVKQAILAAERKLKTRRVGLLADLPGPKIRLESNFVLPKDVLHIGLDAGEEDIVPGAESPAERPLASTVRLFYGEDAFGTAQPQAALAILTQIKERLEIGGTEPLLAFIGDNEATLEVFKVSSDLISCRVLARKNGNSDSEGHGVGKRRGFTIRGIEKPIKSFTTEDEAKLSILIETDNEGPEGEDHQVLSHVGISFCQDRDDVERTLFHTINTLTGLGHYKKLELDDLLNRAPAIIAKIETAAGVRNLHGILDFADGVMIARGDLALEMATIRLPESSKQITSNTNLRGKPVIMATQMLESMKNNIECARPEATDVFNAVADGADALLLSGETSSGKYPGLAIRKMKELALRAEIFLAEEKSPDKLITEYFDSLLKSAHRVKDWEDRWNDIERDYFKMRVDGPVTRKMRDAGKISREEHIFVADICAIKNGRLKKQYSTDRISHAACTMAADSRIEALVSPTTSGRTSRMLSRFRPRVGVFSLPHSQLVARKLQTSWGVKVIGILGIPDDLNDIHWLMRSSGNRCLQIGLDGPVVFTCGTPLSKVGTTNMVQRWDKGGIPSTDET